MSHESYFSTLADEPEPLHLLELQIGNEHLVDNANQHTNNGAINSIHMQNAMLQIFSKSSTSCSVSSFSDTSCFLGLTPFLQSGGTPEEVHCTA